MNFGKVLRFGLAALTAVFLCAVAASPALALEGKPNVVFILADNVGYGDLGPYGGGELRGAPTRPNCKALNWAPETSALDLADSIANAVGSTKADASVVAAAVEIVCAGAVRTV